jgi:hypothetical protein
MLSEEELLPHRVQRMRSKGWRMPPNTVYVGRPTVWGNPYKVDTPPPKWPEDEAWGRAEAVRLYELMLAGGWRLRRRPGFEIVRRAMAELEGKNLACWCPIDQPCHADVLLLYANAGVDGQGRVAV